MMCASTHVWTKVSVRSFTLARQGEAIRKALASQRNLEEDAVEPHQSVRSATQSKTVKTRRNQNWMGALPMVDIQTVMSFVSMRMGQQTASKIATVLLTATHVKMTRREECVIACRKNILMNFPPPIAFPIANSIGPGRH